MSSLFIGSLDYLANISGSAWGLLLKSTLVFLFALLVQRAIHRTSAAFRSSLWFTVLCAVLLLPLMTVLMPGWSLPQWLLVQLDPSSGTEWTVQHGDVGAEHTRSAVAEARAGETLDSSEPPGVPVSRWSSALSAMGLTRAFAVVWAVGAVLLLCSFLLGLRRVAALRLNSESIDDPAWQLLLCGVLREVGITQPVDLRVGPEGHIPMTWGFRRPVILLPAEAQAWSDAQRRMVLLHECAHIRRRDGFGQLLSRMVSALYWVNPLVWIVSRALRGEQERACDDLVLSRGVSRRHYARFLIQIARDSHRVPSTGLLGIAMACRPGLEERVRGILSSGSGSTHGRGFRWVVGVVVILVSVLVGAMRVEGDATSAKDNDWPAEQPGDVVVATNRSLPEASAPPAPLSSDIKPQVVDLRNAWWPSEDPPAGLETRVLKVNPEVFRRNLHEKYGAKGPLEDGETEKDHPPIRKFLASVGFDPYPPNEVYYGVRKGVLMVRGKPEEIAALEAAIAELNMTKPQADIEVKIVEVDTEVVGGLGLGWFVGGVHSNSAASLSASSNRIGKGVEKTLAIPPDVAEVGIRMEATGIVTKEQFREALDKLEKSKGVAFVAAPRVITVSGQRAEVSVSRAVRLEEDDPSSEVTVGPRVSCLPSISGDGRSILLDLEVEIRRLVEDGAAEDAHIRPRRSISSCEVTTRVVIQNGETVVLSGVAGGDGPRRKNTIVFVTAKVVDDQTAGF